MYILLLSTNTHYISTSPTQSTHAAAKGLRCGDPGPERLRACACQEACRELLALGVVRGKWAVAWLPHQKVFDAFEHVRVQLVQGPVDGTVAAAHRCERAWSAHGGGRCRSGRPGVRGAAAHHSSARTTRGASSVHCAPAAGGRHGWGRLSRAIAPRRTDAPGGIY